MNHLQNNGIYNILAPLMETHYDRQTEKIAASRLMSIFIDIFSKNVCIYKHYGIDIRHIDAENDSTIAETEKL